MGTSAGRLVAALAALAHELATTAAPPRQKPHLIFNMIDDLGWADVVWHLH